MSETLDKINATAMEIIVSAGESRVEITNALKAIADQDFQAIEGYLTKAKTYITKAHALQTDTIQNEDNGEAVTYSLLFAHAQDTLMTIYSELNMTRQLAKIFESYDKRIKILEGKQCENTVRFRHE